MQKGLLVKQNGGKVVKTISGHMQLIGIDNFKKKKHLMFCALFSGVSTSPEIVLKNIGPKDCHSGVEVEMEAELFQAVEFSSSDTSLHLVRRFGIVIKFLSANGFSINGYLAKAESFDSVGSMLLKHQLSQVKIIRSNSINNVNNNNKRQQHLVQAIPSGDRKLLLVRVKLVDDSSVDSYVTENDLLEYGWGAESVLTTFSQSSYGILNISQSMGDVKTVTLPHSASRYTDCNYELLGNDAVASLEATGYSTSNFDLISFYMPLSIADCDFAGIAYVGGQRSWEREAGVPTLVHELGHSLGVLHAATDPDNDSIQDSEYEDYSSIMGAPSTAVTLHGVFRLLLGWINPNSAAHKSFSNCGAGTSCTEVINIADLQQSPQESVSEGQVTLVQLPRRKRAGGSFYFLSYRRGTVGQDINLQSQYKNVVSLHHYSGDPMGSNSHFIQTLGVGESFNDVVDNYGTPVTATSITVQSISNGVATVQVFVNDIPPPAGYIDVIVAMTDTGGDGWNGNILYIGRERITLESGSSGQVVVCLPSGTYSPYGCNGDWDEEVGWSIIMNGVTVISGGIADDTCSSSAGSFTVTGEIWIPPSIEFGFKILTASRLNKLTWRGSDNVRLCNPHNSVKLSILGITSIIYDWSEDGKVNALVDFRLGRSVQIHRAFIKIWVTDGEGDMEEIPLFIDSERLHHLSPVELQGSYPNVRVPEGNYRISLNYNLPNQNSEVNIEMTMRRDDESVRAKDCMSISRAYQS